MIMHQQLQQQSQYIKEQGVDATFITGQSIDAFCSTKQNDLTTAQQVVKDLTRENDQLKKLNEKLVQKAEELQSVIEQEASAHSYYYNYPPKNEAQDEGIANKKKDTEQQKLKRIFDEQLAAVEKKWERKFTDFAESIAE